MTNKKLQLEVLDLLYNMFSWRDIGYATRVAMGYKKVDIKKFKKQNKNKPFHMAGLGWGKKHPMAMIHGFTVSIERNNNR